MRDVQLTAKIDISKKAVKVAFEGGLWTRAMVDAAYNGMLRALPAHISQHKARIEKSEPKKIEENAK